MSDVKLSTLLQRYTECNDWQLPCTIDSVIKNTLFSDHKKLELMVDTKTFVVYVNWQNPYRLQPAYVGVST